MSWTGRLGTFAWAEAGDGHVATSASAKTAITAPILIQCRSALPH